LHENACSAKEWFIICSSVLYVNTLHYFLALAPFGTAPFDAWFGIELTRENFKSLFVPKGYAHGFITLTDDVDVTYQVSHRHVSGDEGGFRYDDPYFKIMWPQEVLVISDKDKTWNNYR
jgi:dTDP-4-dehydrorhamnose 3,5-epimerase